MKKLTFLCIILLSLASLAHGQQNYFYFSWDINTPTSSTDWLKSSSASGAKAGYRFFPENLENFSFGIDVNWGAYDQYFPRQTFTTDNSSFTTDYFNYIYTVGATISSQYYFKVGDGDRFYPYVGLGLGANNNQYMTYYNVYTEEDRRWGFLARPEAGIIAKIGRTIGVLAAVHYDYSTNSSEYFDYKNFSAVGFQLGIVAMNRR